MPLNVKGRLGRTYSNLDRHQEQEKDNHRMHIRTRCQGGL